MKRLSARYLSQFEPEQLWEWLTGEFVLVFDDGEIVTNWKETVYSSYSWVFHRQYPFTPILKSHHSQTVLRGGTIGSRTDLDLIGNVMWSTYTACVEQVGFADIDYLSKLIYQTVNRMYNSLSYRTEDYVASISIFDFIDITDHEDVRSILENLEPNQNSIDEAYSVLNKLLSDKSKLQSNPLSKAYKAGLINKNQLMQCVGVIGYRTDIDSNIFPIPVMRNFVRGIRSMHDSLIESRSAAKALYFSKDPLQDAEYFSRRLQLLCMVVQNLHREDCGSKEYLIWKVNPPTYQDGKIYYKGDLQHLVGKYYLNEETDQLQAIKITDTHLYNKTIKIRSVVAGCAHPDPHGICSVCFGDLSYSVPVNSNIGHMCAVSMTQQSSQSVLSVKHLDGSSSVEGIVLTHDGKWFFKVSKDKSSYLMNDEKKNTGLKIVIDPNEAIGLTDVNIVSDTNNLTITRVSEISYVGFVVTEKGVTNTIPVSVSIDNRLASLTHEFLRYVKVHGWSVDEKDNFVVDLDHWDFSKPILTLPQKHFNMSAHASEISNIIESRVKELTERSKANSPNDTLVELFDLVNTKLNVNLAVLEVILYSAMIVSAEKNDYRLPKPWTTKGLGVASLTIPNRSLAPAMAYEKQRNVIVSPESFFNENRPSHPMDVFMMPFEVISYLDSKGIR